MAVVYIASDVPGAGKTAFCASLARLLLRRGKRVAVVKLQDSQSRDADIYEKLLGQDGAAVSLARPDAESAVEAIEKAGQDSDFVLMEGLSGLDNGPSADVAKAVGARTIVIVRYTHQLKATDLLPARELFGEGLLGVVVNGRTRYRGTYVSQSLAPSMESEGVSVLGVIPEDRRLLGVSVGQITEHLNGRYLGYIENGMQDYLVEHFLIGGLILDWGVNYFNTRDHKAVISRGERPDIQMAALETSTSCLVATGGREPLEYVMYEAEQEEVPVVVVDTDTLSTARSLDTIVEKAQFDHPLKLERFGELIEANLQIDQIASF